MNKVKQPLQNLLGPIPAAVIGCGDGERQNLITLAWVGSVNSSPPMLSISIRPQRYSYEMVRNSGEFTVNLLGPEMVETVDGCGTLSGRDVDKFSFYGFTPCMGQLKYAPMIEEAPVSLECRVEHSLDLPSHRLFIGPIVAVYLQPHLVDGEGKVRHDQLPLLGFMGGTYLAASSLDRKIAFSLKKDGREE